MNYEILNRIKSTPCDPNIGIGNLSKEDYQALMKNEFALAKGFAYGAHFNHKRNDNKYYVKHLKAVQEGLPDWLKPAGWTHDVCEDIIKDRTRMNLLMGKMGFSEHTIQTVNQVTYFKDEGLTKHQYLHSILNEGSLGSVCVKLVDMHHNLSQNPSEKARDRYTAFIPLFENKYEDLMKHTFM